MLDYVGRDHEIEIRLSVRGLSVRVAVISVPNVQISFKI